MLNKLTFWKKAQDTVIEYQDILFPPPILQVLLARSASAEVRRHHENKGNVFETILVDREFQQDFIASYVRANLDFFEVIRPHIPNNCRRVLDGGMRNRRSPRVLS